MKERFLCPAHFGKKLYDVIHITFAFDRLLKIFRSGQHLVFPLGVLNDFTLLGSVNVPAVNMQRYVFLVRLRNESDEESFSRLNRIEKCINEQGFNCRRADKDDTKRVIARYFGVKTSDTAIEDHDGDKAAEKWIIPD